MATDGEGGFGGPGSKTWNLASLTIYCELRARLSWLRTYSPDTGSLGRYSRRKALNQGRRPRAFSEYCEREHRCSVSQYRPYDQRAGSERRQSWSAVRLWSQKYSNNGKSCTTIAYCYESLIPFPLLAASIRPCPDSWQYYVYSHSTVTNRQPTPVKV